MIFLNYFYSNDRLFFFFFFSLVWPLIQLKIGTVAAEIPALIDNSGSF
jgi:hypothetical protein